ncbi:hypothetical protein [uncultured Tenacibaculum sp.]|uniref:hypothetical protein n=1 Tax=uncultured Tenacibaculum sp. TaxID=174713 RepID=UPI00260E0F9A|nr:hypothetical protein [uncultured Tenacibaculum sp.]
MATKTIYGTVSSNGSIISGSGFIVQKQNTGTYLIDFEPGFSQTPAVVGSQTGYGSIDENPLDNVVFPYINQGSTTALTADSSGHKKDRQFSFIAIGEQ